MKPLGKASKYTLLTILLFWVIFDVLAYILLANAPLLFTPWLLAPPLFFSLFAAFSFKKVVLNPTVRVSALLFTKTARLLVTMALVLLYIVFVKDNSVVFVITFGAYFLLYLILETLIMVRMNRSKKAEV